MTPLSIAHVLSSFEIGGQERVALDLARTQRALGHSVTAFSIARPPDGPLAVEFRRAGVDTETVAKGWKTDLTLPIRLARRFRHRRIDIVHTHNPLALTYGAPGGKLAGAAVVHTKHGGNRASWRHLVMRRAVARLADVYVAVSRVTAEQARAQREVPDDKLRVIPNGVDLTRFAPDANARREVRAELGIPASAWVVGSVGRLMEYKNHALLLEAVRPSLGVNARLVIIGDGPLAGALARAVSAAGVSAWVHLLGARVDVPRLLTALDVFALPSRIEGLPLVLPEAMATALPIVATAVGGIPDVVSDGQTGFLVAATADALREKLAALAADPELARRFGATGRALALERFTLDRMTADYMALYRRVVRSVRYSPPDVGS